MNHGKHVYCQKPLTHDLYEARQMRLIAKDKGVVTQMAPRFIRTKPTALPSVGPERHDWQSTRSAFMEQQDLGYEGDLPKAAPVPDFLNWDLWIGTAPMRDYAAGSYHPADWRRWYDFGCGTMGDMAIQILRPRVHGARTENAGIGSFKQFSSTEVFVRMQNHTRYQFKPTKYTTDEFLLTWSDGGKMPDTTAWPKPLDDKGNARSLPDQGSMFVGEKGYVLLPHVAMPSLLPAEAFSKTNIERVAGGDHYHLFIDACFRWYTDYGKL